MKIKHCRDKMTLECIYLTKENHKDFLNYIMYFTNYKIEENNEKYILVKDLYYNSLHFFMYNNWYVNEYNYEHQRFQWTGYSNKEFKYKYDFIN